MSNLSPPIFLRSLAVAGGAALSILVAIPAHALSFNFGWSNDNVDDTNIISGGAFPANITAVGTLDINRNAGESFTIFNVANVNILATNPQGSFTYTSLAAANGTISADGLSASITDIFANSATTFFGCTDSNCNNTVIGLRTIPASSGGTRFDVTYNSLANARASFQLTAATPVPFEFSPALGLGVLGGALLLGKKFKKKSPKV